MYRHETGHLCGLVIVGALVAWFLEGSPLVDRWLNWRDERRTEAWKRGSLETGGDVRNENSPTEQTAGAQPRRNVRDTPHRAR